MSAFMLHRCSACTVKHAALIPACSQSEKERVMENKRQVQSLVIKSKTIVRLKPRNPEEKSNSPVIVQAICDFKQDQVGRTLSLTHARTHPHTHAHTHTCTR